MKTAILLLPLVCGCAPNEGHYLEHMSGIGPLHMEPFNPKPLHDEPFNPRPLR